MKLPDRLGAHWKRRLLLTLGAQLLFLAILFAALWLWANYDFFPMWIILGGCAFFLTASAGIAFRDRFQSSK